MIVGQTLLYSGTNAYFSPTFPRGGLAALFSVEVTLVEGSSQLGIDVEHKNEEDTSFTTAASFSTMSSAGTYSKDITGLKEQIRLKYNVAGGSSGDYVHVIVAPPAWRPY